MMSNESSVAKLRVVVDTNVYIATVLRPGGLSDKVMRLIYEGYADLYYSKDILIELEKQLLNRRFEIDTKVAHQVIKNIEEVANRVETQPVTESRLRDPDDLHILACAVVAKADLIVTLDKDLLSLKQTHGIGIIHPQSFRYMAIEK